MCWMPEQRGADVVASLATCPDSVLIQMSIAGRGDCFSLLMDRHLAAVRHCLRFMVSDAADLDDLVQEVLLKVWRHLATFRAESSLRTWMIRIGINEARQLYRRDKCRRLCQPLDDYETIASPIEPPDQRLVEAETAHTVRSALAKLPRIYREVLILRDLRELSGEETAQYLRTTTQAMKSRLFRARVMLSTSLGPSPGLAPSETATKARGYITKIQPRVKKLGPMLKADSK